MGIFIIMYIVFALLACIYYGKNNDQKPICIICFILLFAIQALRSTQIGYDSFNTYLPAFSFLNVHSIGDVFTQDPHFKFEKGYVIYESIIRLLTDNENVFLAITSAVILIPISWTIYKFSKIPLLSFVIFASLILYHFSFSGLRQSIAFALTFASTYFIVNRKLIPFLLIIFIASQFHASSIIFIIAYFIYGVKFESKKAILLACSIAVLFLAISPVVEFLRPILFGESKYTSYDDKGAGALGLTIFYIVLTIFSLIRIKSVDSSEKMPHFLAWTTMLIISFQPLAIISETADRLGYYFLIYYSLSIPETISRFTLSQKHFYCLLFFVMMAAVFFYCNAGGYLEVIPYKFFWQI